MLAQGDLNSIARIIRIRSKSMVQSYGLIRDLSEPFKTPSPKIPISVRPIRAKDIPIIFERPVSGIKAEDILARKVRMRLLKANIGTCYVALTQEDLPCYVQWRFTSEQNEMVRAFFGGVHPPIKEDEKILENAFTLESYRIIGVMSCAMSQIAETGVDIGVRWVWTFVDIDNIPSLKGCTGAGFQSAMIQRIQWRLFRRKVIFESLLKGVRSPWQQSQRV
jgi:hypothetical protein